MSVPIMVAEVAPVYGLTSGRVVSLVAALVALAGVGFGGMALFRFVRRRAVIALAAGAVGVVGGGWVVAVAEGGPGTGAGIVGGLVALVLGLVALALGGMALKQS
ncbi:DUF6223 family protein [Herbidospora sp. NBRC 101105]|uniref:DUF6223 family protein n=1 Tax=Herbidospora sp. NBRC 101105 TaxID=3032195 RepID=UPI0024A19027|nr:DUF6223 family protein [Herbidospora sp. NBRC 101105]GLX98714.1 hypothetical protein Hesp01_66640 [Herbidospora sp. NBRC 101105]